MFWLRFFSKLFKILNGDISAKQIAGGFAFGVILGLTPILSLHNILVLLLICIVRVNVTSVIFSMAIFKLLGILVLDPLLHQVGYLLLVKFEFLKPFWTFLYNLPIVALTRFNNTLLLGGVVISLVLFYPNLILIRKGVLGYRALVQPKLEKMRIFQILKATKIYRLYRKITSFKG